MSPPPHSDGVTAQRPAAVGAATGGPRGAVGAQEMSVLRSGLAVAADAVGITVIRAAYSTTIKGGADVSSGLFDVRGRLLALSDTSMIGHLAPLRCAVRSILEDFPPDTIEPGDVFIMNDPYRGGVHANDMQVFATVFLDGRLQYLTGAMVHVADVGGTAPGGCRAPSPTCSKRGSPCPRYACTGPASRSATRSTSWPPTPAPRR